MVGSAYLYHTRPRVTADVASADSCRSSCVSASHETKDDP